MKIIKKFNDLIFRFAEAQLLVGRNPSESSEPFEEYIDMHFF